ncbi:MAG: hypothetical protein M5R41_11535 [Bacteroidia bacterium]|nr:hypothetical protein [Bacteroidia bacterium]
MRKTRLHAALATILAFCAVLAFPVQAQWTQTNGPEGASVRAICASGSNFFAGTGGGVYYTTNNGASWVFKGLAHLDVNALAVSGSTIYAGGAGAIHRSSDLGTTWTEVSTGLTNTNVRSLCIKDSYVFAGTAAGVFRADHSGGSWTSVSNNALSGEMVFSLTVSGNFVVAGTWKGGIYRSNNYGGSWNKTNTGLTHLSVRALYRSSSGSYLYAGGDGGVHRSTNNGKDWTFMNTGLVTGGNTMPIVYGLAGTGAKVYAATWYGGVYYSSDRAANWTATTLQQGSALSVAVVGSNVLAGTLRNGVHRTTNLGSSWTAMNTGLRASHINALASNGSILFAGGSIPADVMKSTDEGASWTGTLPSLP